MQYVVKYKLYFYTFNKEIEDAIKVDNGLSYFNGERNCRVYNEADAVDYVKAIHKLEEINILVKRANDFGMPVAIQSVVLTL